MLDHQPWVVLLHLFVAVAALVLGLVQILGGQYFQQRGIAISSFFIHSLNLSVITLIELPAAVYAARKHAVKQHRRAMLMIYLLALVITGLFYPVPRKADV